LDAFVGKFRTLKRTIPQVLSMIHDSFVERVILDGETLNLNDQLLELCVLDVVTLYNLMSKITG
jgi:hypothetical protein